MSGPRPRVPAPVVPPPGDPAPGVPPRAAPAAVHPPSVEVDVDVESSEVDVPEPSASSARSTAIARFGRYEVLGRLAVGGMADVYLARETSDVGASRTVVLKFVRDALARDDDFVAMFLDEGRVALGLAHPNICHVYEFGKLQDRYFISMEWVRGATLGEILRASRKRKRPLPVPFILKIASEVAAALQYAHRLKDEQGRSTPVVHRDVTPHNIMVSYDGVVKLLDFGIAKMSFKASSTQAGNLKGKFAYVSPEQIRGGEVDGRSDVFSLGICLFEALTGRRLYRRETEYEILQAILHEPAPSIRDVDPRLPRDLAAIVQKVLAKDPTERFATAGALHEALEQFIRKSREVVTASRFGEHMQALFAEEMERGPILEVREEITRTFQVADVSDRTPAVGSGGESRKFLPWIVALAGAGAGALIAALAVLIVGGVAVWALWPEPEPASSSAAAPEARAGAERGSEPASGVVTRVGSEGGSDPERETGSDAQNETVRTETDLDESDTGSGGGAEADPGAETEAGTEAGPGITSFEAARRQARAHYRARRYRQAAAAYTEAVRLKPSHAGSHAGLGASLLKRGRPAAAVRAYRQAVRLAPRHSGFRAALAYSYEKSGNRAQAIAEYRHALRLDRRNGAAREGLRRLGAR